MADKVGVVLAEDTLAAMFNSVSSLKADQVCVLTALERAKLIGSSDRASVDIENRGKSDGSERSANDKNERSNSDGSSQSNGDWSEGSDGTTKGTEADTNISLASGERSAADKARNIGLPSQRRHSRRITAPILIVHGTSDGTVAFRHSKILTDALGEYFLHLGVDLSAMIEHFVHEGGHVRAYEHSEYHPKLVAFFRKNLK